jgi:hypothetical protein
MPGVTTGTDSDELWDQVRACSGCEGTWGDSSGNWLRACGGATSCAELAVQRAHRQAGG